MGRLKVISLDPTIKERKKRRNRVKLFLTKLSIKPKTEQVARKTKYKLPDINYLEKNLSKLSSDGNKNRPNAEFMETLV